MKTYSEQMAEWCPDPGHTVTGPRWCPTCNGRRSAPSFRAAVDADGLRVVRETVNSVTTAPPQ